MNMMEIRKRVLMNMVNGKIPTKTFVTTKAYSNTGAFKNDIVAELGVESFIAVSKRDTSTFEYNGIYCIYYIVVENVSVEPMHGGLRYRNSWGAVSVAPNYDASIPVGDEYTVYILDNLIDI